MALSGAPLGELCDHTHELREQFRNTNQITQAAHLLREPFDQPMPTLECVAGDGLPVRYIPAPAEHVPTKAREYANKLRSTSASPPPTSPCCICSPSPTTAGATPPTPTSQAN